MSEPPDEPMIVRIRAPATKPASAPFALLVSVGAVAMQCVAAWVFVRFALGRPDWIGGFILAQAAAIALFLVALVIISKWRTWRDAQVELELAVAAQPDRTAANDEELRQRYELAVRRGLGGFGTERQRWRRVRKEFVKLRTPVPRVVLVGERAWMDSMEIDNDDGGVTPEPELIRSSLLLFTKNARERGGWKWWFFTAVFVLTPLAVVRSLQLTFGKPVRSITSQTVLFAVSSVLCVASTMLFAIRASGRSLFGGLGLWAAPGVVGWDDGWRTTRWTPRESMLIVNGDGLIDPVRVYLVSERSRGPTARMAFINRDDEGFRTLWRMWTHPRSAESLLESERDALRAAVARARASKRESEEPAAQ